MKISVLQISQVVGGRLLASAEAAAQQCTSCSWDSREVAPGSVYFGLPGANVDGAKFVDRAFEAMAVLAVIRKAASEEILEAAAQATRNLNKALIVVEDPQLALQELAHFWAGKIGVNIVGITGSVGKTTTKNFVATVLDEKFKVVCNKGNKNNEIGMPATVLSADKGTEILVAEMGMYNRGEIARLCEIAQPNLAMITNVEDCHIESCGSSENIAKAKSEIFENLGLGDLGLIRKDCNFHDLVLEHSGVLSSGAKLIDIEDQLYLKNVELDKFQRASFDFDFDGSGNSKHCQLHTLGIYNVKNAVFAGIVGAHLGMKNDQIKRGLENCQAEEGRMQIFERAGEGLVIINDAYNANPQSMSQGIAAFERIEFKGEKIAILGSMLELGPTELKIHHEIGKLLQNCSSITKYILVGELGAHIADNFSKEELENTLFCSDSSSAKKELEKMNLYESLLYFKASNSIKLNDLAKAIHRERLL
ncbi:MAG: UDP-N-acetylmuramoyl-tripeptide--D-alanyl-D-alanine ligase [Eggerthellaceae bacterium]|nr:UDP-N-acetylmuramoyl-tripeptide--D-alanyl-D-alanine ligase [Eggerthellaceae bacterium]